MESRYHVAGQGPAVVVDLVEDCQEKDRLVRTRHVHPGDEVEEELPDRGIIDSRQAKYLPNLLDSLAKKVIIRLLAERQDMVRDDKAPVRG